MKKILDFLKTFLYGILPAISGGLIMLEIMYIIDNIKLINTESGWYVVGYFILMIIELILTVCLVHALGVIQLNSKKWVAYKKEETVNNIDSDLSNCETSDKVTDSNSKHKNKKL